MTGVGPFAIREDGTKLCGHCCATYAPAGGHPRFCPECVAKFNEEGALDGTEL